MVNFMKLRSTENLQQSLAFHQNPPDDANDEVRANFEQTFNAIKAELEIRNVADLELNSTLAVLEQGIEQMVTMINTLQQQAGPLIEERQRRDREERKAELLLRSKHNNTMQ